MNVNSDFEKDLIYSKEEDFLKKLDLFYKKYFSGVVNIERKVTRKQEYEGIDVIITLENGQQILIDEKKRRDKYDDILLEVYSNETTKRLGYILDPKKQTDFIIYAFEPTGEVYIFSHAILKKVLLDNRDDWERKYGLLKTDPQKQPNISTGIPVPFEDVFLAMIKPFSLYPLKSKTKKPFPTQRIIVLMDKEEYTKFMGINMKLRGREITSSSQVINKILKDYSPKKTRKI